MFTSMCLALAIVCGVFGIAIIVLGSMLGGK